MARLAEAIPTDPQIILKDEVIEVWDGLIALLPFLLLVTVEWSLRKLWGVL